MNRARAFAIAGILAVSACSKSTRTVVLAPNPDVQEAPRSAVATLGIPPGQLPQIGECRVWVPGTPPAQQPKPRSRPCGGISAFAPAGSWIIQRPSENRRLVYVREVDSGRAGLVIRTRIYDVDTSRFLREENP